ncbi:MAG: serine--tRNA ligase [Patescibacteria group bacterium]
MLDIKFIRENKELVKKAIKDKGVNLDIDELLHADSKRRDLIWQVEEYRRKRNEVSEAVANEKDIVKKNDLIAETRSLKENGKILEDRLRQAEEEYDRLMLLVPNIPSPEAPVGPDAGYNKKIYKWGEPPVFDFPVKNHAELAEGLGLIDFENGARVSGFRGYYLKNEAVLMHLGIVWHALRKMAARGFELTVPPTIVREFALIGSGHFPYGKEEIYQIANPGHLEAKEGEKESAFLAGTSEPSLLAMFAGRHFKEAELPVKICGISQCYRSEIGSYGKDTKGIYRVHEFMKVEQVILCKNDLQESEKWFQEILAIAREILEELKLPYRVIDAATGDMGAGKYRRNDIEVWMPGRGDWGETHSNSMLTDWQARRLNIKYADSEGAAKFVHTLNNTVIASPRILIAILENYQRADGSVVVPEILREYVGKDLIQR